MGQTGELRPLYQQCKLWSERYNRTDPTNAGSEAALKLIKKLIQGSGKVENYVIALKQKPKEKRFSTLNKGAELLFLLFLQEL